VSRALSRSKMLPEERRAFDEFIATVRAHYGPRLHDIILFGSRARGEARADSDVDLAVILSEATVDFWHEKMLLTDLAYNAMAVAGLIIQAWPLSKVEWEAPEMHFNPRFVAAMKRDARSLGEVG
jgi:predicted nucleotidyltransferase